MPPSASTDGSRSSCCSRVGALLAVLLLSCGCGGRADSELVDRGLSRSARFGVFGDLVLLEGPGGPYFIDRFETTRGDWRAWREAVGDSPEEVDAFLQRWGGSLESRLPVTGMPLREAQAYARWRFCRLPRLGEWLHAATGGGRYERPWGNQLQPWANTTDLRIAGFTPVGTFESGRQQGGAYDLVGNAAEWTLTVPARVWGDNFGLGEPEIDRRLRVAGRHPALAPWAAPGLPRVLPMFWVLEARSRAGVGLPRQVAPGRVVPAAPRPLREGVFEMARGERSEFVGLRLAVDPEELLIALGRSRAVPGPEEELSLRAFLRRPRHRRVLAVSFARLAASLPEDTALARLLRQELGP